MTGSLFVVGTPIGNLGDMSQRAIDTLNMVDFIAAEDTRVTRKLLSHFDIKKPMISYFEHNKYQRGEIICERILNGENCAIVTDAGMPAISDPGEILVKQCHEKGIEVKAIPGPSALISALAISGLPSGRFTFEGFLSVNKKSRKEHLEEIKNEKRTMIFYEAPHKLLNTLKDLYMALGERDVAIVREITKVHEEIKFINLKDAESLYSNGVKGEIVIIIKGKEQSEAQNIDISTAVNMAMNLINDGMGITEAAKAIAKDTEFSKSEIYKAILMAQESNE